MHYASIFTKEANKDLEIIFHRDRYRIVKRIEFYISTGSPLKFAKPLRNHPYGDFRFRIGDYRAIFYVKQISMDELILVVTRIGNRKDVYD